MEGNGDIGVLSVLVHASSRVVMTEYNVSL
jgi:hypothetical protein